MEPARSHRLHRATLTTAIAALLGVASLTLTQCRMGADRLTGAPVLRAVEEGCIKQCSELYRALQTEERSRHAANMKNCHALQQLQRASCLKAEEERHRAEMKRLQQAKGDCQKACRHTQGSGGTP